MPSEVLCLNAGSSSIKFKVYVAGDDGALAEKAGGQVDGIGSRRPRLRTRSTDGAAKTQRELGAGACSRIADALPVVVDWLAQDTRGNAPVAVAHRIVTGGRRFTTPLLIDEEALAALDDLVPLAPLHMPGELELVRAATARLPDSAQVAVFDTAFHSDRDPLSIRLPVPASLHEAGLMRYGYHGISYEYIARRLPEVAPVLAAGRVVVAHLGSGCSMCAMLDGRSIETTMSFSTLDGLPMSTRPGRLDAGAVLWLMQARGLSVDEVATLLYRDCGLKGISGHSGDVRELLASDDEAAALALRYFSSACARMIAELATVMEGVDGIVFTAGIGENQPRVRADVCARLAWLGVQLADGANADGELCVSAPDSRVGVYVIPTDEERVMADHAWSLTGSQPA